MHQVFCLGQFQYEQNKTLDAYHYALKSLKN